MGRATKASANLSGTLGLVYDAVLDPDGWTPALEAICNYVGGISANVFWARNARDSAVVHSFGENDEYTQSYSETYRHLNPYLPALSLIEPGRVVSGADLVPTAAFAKTRFFNEWVRPQGFSDVLGASLARETHGSALFSVRRGATQGLVDAGALRRMQLITPHVRRAVLTERLIERHQHQAASLEQLVDGLAVAVLLVDRTGRVMHANPAADRLLTDGSIIKIADRRLVTSDISKRQGFATALADTFDDGAGGYGRHPSPIALKGGDDAKWFAHVLPLRPGDALEWGGQACAAVFVQPAWIEARSTLAWIGSSYRLTPGELRVLARLVEPGGSVADLALALDLSAATIRTHLRALFAKTGTTRQVDLVRFVAARQILLAKS